MRPWVVIVVASVSVMMTVGCDGAPSAREEYAAKVRSQVPALHNVHESELMKFASHVCTEAQQSAHAHSHLTIWVRDGQSFPDVRSMTASDWKRLATLTNRYCIARDK